MVGRVMNREEQNKIIRGMLYEFSVNQELEWRAKPEYQRDSILIDEMISEINALGFEFEYLTDIDRLVLTNADIVNIILDYMGRFDNFGIAADLVVSLGHKSNKYATERLIDLFEGSHDYFRHGHAVGFDNTFNRIKDKRYIGKYLEWLKDEEVANELPFTMLMVARWKVPEAKPLFLGYLDLDKETQLVYTSIKALPYYIDEESIEKVASMQNHQNRDIADFATKTLKKMMDKMT
jgi:hypothetical protein